MPIKGMKPLDLTVYVVAGIAAVNWGLGPLGYNLVDSVLGAVNFTAYADWVYYAIGIAGVYSLYKLFSKK